MPNGRYVNKEHDIISPARLFVITDETDDTMVEIARILEASKTTVIEKVPKTENIDGETTAIDHVKTKREITLSVKFAERLSSELMSVLLGIDPVVAASTVAASREILRFHDTDPRVVAHPYSIVSSGPPPTGTPSATAFGTGGSIAAGTYAIDIEAEYESGLRSALLEGTTVIVSSGQMVALLWTAPTGGIVPKYYNIYASNTGETSPERYRWLQVAGSETACVLTNDPTDVVYPGDPGDAYSLIDLDTELEVDSADYMFDTTAGLIQSVSLTSNKQYKLEYNYTKPATTTFSEGKPSSKSVYRKLLIMQVDELDDKELSKIWRIERVDVREGLSEAMHTTSFDDGITVTFTCEYDVVTQRTGQTIIGGSIVENWGTPALTN